MTPETPISKCRYCRSPFAPRSSGGTKQEFCSAAHRKLFHKFGGQTVAKQTDRVRREVLALIRRELPDLVERAVMRAFTGKQLRETCRTIVSDYVFDTQEIRNICDEQIAKRVAFKP